MTAAATIPPADGDGPDGGARAYGVGEATDDAKRLVSALAAAAVRRDPRELTDPLRQVAPWAQPLPPAAWRTFAAEVTAVLRAGSADQQSLGAVLNRWHAVAARFA